MKWQGIRRGSIDIGKDAGEGLLAVNTRFKVAGELRRRRGLARTSIQRKNAGVTTINGFSAFQSNVMAALTDGDRIQGYQQPYSLWGDNPNYTVGNLSGGVFFDGTTVGSDIANLGTDALFGNGVTGPGFVSSSTRSMVFNNQSGNVTAFNATRSPSLSVTSATMNVEMSITGSNTSNITIVGIGTLYMYNNGSHWTVAFFYPTSLVQTTVTNAFASTPHKYSGHWENGYASISIDDVVYSTTSGPSSSPPWPGYNAVSLDMNGPASYIDMKYMSYDYTT